MSPSMLFGSVMILNTASVGVDELRVSFGLKSGRKEALETHDARRTRNTGIPVSVEMKMEMEMIRIATVTALAELGSWHYRTFFACPHCADGNRVLFTKRS